MILADVRAYFSFSVYISFGELLSFRRTHSLSVTVIRHPTLQAASIIPYPDFEFRERPVIVPPGVVSLLRP